MKGFGWFCVILGCAFFLGAAINGNNVFGPAFWLALGIYLVHRAKKSKRIIKKYHRIFGNSCYLSYICCEYIIR